MRSYHDLLQDVLTNGTRKENRTGIDTIAVFGRQWRHDLSTGFPLLTTKKIHFKSVVHELLWFLSGDSNIKYLNDHGVRIWNEWATQDGELGPVYGFQWRFWPKYDGGSVDQIESVEESLKTNPKSRRHIVSAWNPVDVPYMKLPPCHLLYQFDVTERVVHENGFKDQFLSCHMYMRSADLFLGVPFNICLLYTSPSPRDS